VNRYDGSEVVVLLYSAIVATQHLFVVAAIEVFAEVLKRLIVQ
jgi:hypothetical protein